MDDGRWTMDDGQRLEVRGQGSGRAVAVAGGSGRKSKDRGQELEEVREGNCKVKKSKWKMQK